MRANTETDMDAKTHQLGALLKMERRCVIPTFQRDYEWTREGQWELLYEDLESAARRLANTRRADEATGSLTPVDKISPHFLGAIVLDHHKFQAGGLDHRAVIDGQQRLTTLHLLARALLDVAIELESKQAGSLRRLLEIPDDVVDSPDEIHKLWPRRRDRDEWRAVMGDDVPDNDHRYTQARRFFAEQIRSTHSADESEEVLTFADLVDAFQDLFRIVVIELDPNDDAQVIFEVLNGRQQELSSADLVKNLLFLRVEQQLPGAVEDLYEEFWAPFDEPFWKQTVGRGHAQRRHADRMLAAWLTAVSREAAHPDRLYGLVRRHLDSPGIKAAELLPGIARYAEHYRVVRGDVLASDPEVARSYRTIGSLAQDTSLALLLWLRQALSDHPDLLREAASAIESYLVRRAMIGFSTRGYNAIFQATLEGAREQASPAAIAEAVVGSLAEREGPLGWPTDAEICDAFMNRKFYDNVSKGNIRLILGGIDHQLQAENPKSEAVDHDYDSLTIEHLMPQTWQTNWPVDGDDPAAIELAGQERDRAVHRLGNLTLIKGELNSALGNAAWTDRRNELVHHSALRLNAEIGANESWTRWDESTIAERAEALAAIAARRWPRPDAPLRLS